MKKEFESEKEDAIEYFVDQYRKMLEEHYEDYLENYDKYVGSQPET